MKHFTPNYKFSSNDIMVNAYGGMEKHDQVIRSLQQNNISTVNSLDEIISSSEKQFEAKLKSDRELAGNQLEAINGILDSNAQLKSSLNEGFDGLFNGLNNVTSQLEIQHAAMLEQYQISNSKMDTIAEYIKLPEFEKERLFLIEEAMKFLKQTFISPERYNDALNYFLKANNGNDFFTLKQIGLIYLYGENKLNFKKAVKYLENAYSYANSAQIKPEIGSIAKHLSYVYFLRGEFNKSIKWANIGLEHNYDYGLLFIKSECLMLIGEKQEGIDILKEISEKDIEYLLDALKNDNFKSEELDSLKITFEVEIEYNIRNNIILKTMKNINEKSKLHKPIKIHQKNLDKQLGLIELIEMREECRKILEDSKKELEKSKKEMIESREEIPISDDFEDIDETSSSSLSFNPYSFIIYFFLTSIATAGGLFYLAYLDLIPFFFSYGALVISYLVLNHKTIKYSYGYDLVAIIMGLIVISLLVGSIMSL